MARKKQNRNVTSYKGLKARLLRNKEGAGIRKQGIQNTKDFLARPATEKPKQQVLPKNSEEDFKNLQKDYNKKIGGLKEEYEGRLSNIERANKAAMKGIYGELKTSKESANKFREDVAGAFERMQKRDASKTKAAEEQKKDSSGEKAQDDSNPNEREDIKIEIPTFTTNADEKNIAKPSKDVKAVIDNTTKKVVLKISQKIDIKGITLKITNLYGPRSGKNAVAGRKSGEHSRGVDFTTYDSSGNKLNYPVSIAAGEIVGIHLQGNGKKIRTTEGKAAGYYMDVRLASNPNKIIRYAHLDPGVMDNKDSLIGTQVKRGDILFEGNKFTGSGTGDHIKIFMSDIDKNGKILANYTDKGNDPSNLILNGV